MYNVYLTIEEYICRYTLLHECYILGVNIYESIYNSCYFNLRLPIIYIDLMQTFDTFAMNLN